MRPRRLPSSPTARTSHRHHRHLPVPVQCVLTRHSSSLLPNDCSDGTEREDICVFPFCAKLLVPRGVPMTWYYLALWLAGIGLESVLVARAWVWRGFERFPLF